MENGTVKKEPNLWKELKKKTFNVYELRHFVN